MKLESDIMARIRSNKKINKKNATIMRVLLILGVLVFCFTIIYLIYHVFFRNSNLHTNYSTDKKTEYIMLEGEEEVVASQKYISDLDYTMRYDIQRFKVSKIKKQDVFRFKDNDKVLVVVEKSEFPSTCKEGRLETEYENCYLKRDSITEEYYIKTKNNSFKITVKSPSTTEYQEGVLARIRYMLSTFEIVEKK